MFMVTTFKPKNPRYKGLIEEMYNQCDLLVGYTEFWGGGDILSTWQISFLL